MDIDRLRENLSAVITKVTYASDCVIIDIKGKFRLMSDEDVVTSIPICYHNESGFNKIENFISSINLKHRIVTVFFRRLPSTDYLLFDFIADPLDLENHITLQSCYRVL
jgi:hypothetical protein